MRFSLSLLVATHALPSLGRDVFAHYMLGTITKDHANQDILDAKAMGLDGFALNVANPYDSFVDDSLSYLFGAAQSNGFKLYLSMDLYAQGDACYKSGNKTACGGPSDFSNIIKQYHNGGAWYMGPNGKPMVSTFSSAKWENSTFLDWRKSLGFDIYFVPDFDATQGYNTADPGWWHYWGPTLDGLFSWEFSWPVIGAFNDGDVSSDKTVMDGAHAHQKSYMIGLSMLQYKNSYGANLYRRGELTLPKRIENILNMSPLPEFVQIISWNDGPEGHYIGNLWPEQNTDDQPNLYATQSGAPHNDIQPLLTSFIHAFKNGQPASGMQPVGYTGALWYKTVFQSVQCSDDGTAMYFNRPNGSSTGQDVLNYAVVLPQGTTDSINLFSNGQQVGSFKGKPGLNYGQSTSLNPGTQRMVVGGAHTTGGRCINSACQDDIYNYNPQIIGLQTAKQNDCWAPSGQGIKERLPSGGYKVVYRPTYPYMSQNCGNDAVTNVYKESGADLWSKLDVQHAWDDAVTSWVADQDKPKNFEFTQELSIYFNVTNVEWTCSALAASSTQCKVPIGCPDAKWPAGWVVMNSIAGLEGTISAAFSALTNTESYISDKTSSLVSTFGNIQTNNIAGIFSIISVGLGILGTPMFGDILKTLNNFKEGLGDTVTAIKDQTTNLVSQNIAQANLVMGSGDNSVSEQNTLHDNIAGIIKDWQTTLTQYNAKLFGGESEQITSILHYIVDGTFFLGGGARIPTIDIQAATERALFPLLIAQLWTLGNAPAFILDAKSSCDSSSKAPKAPTDKSTFLCVGGKGYFLASANGQAYSPTGCNPANPRMICTQRDFSAPPGTKALDGKTWGNITVADFITGSVNTYNSNKKKNGVANGPDFATGIVGELYDNMDNPSAIFSIPGMFNLPICAAEEAQSNWRETSYAGRAKTPNYPCN